jgi:prefoldin subunit 5
MEATIERLREEISQLLKQKADLSKEIKELQQEQNKVLY